jgi:hypothetical protein
VRIKQIWFSAALALSVILPIQVSTGSVNAAIVKGAEDPTRNLSKEERKKISFEVWVDSPTAKYLKKVESNNNCKSTGGNGKYQGTWQMNASFWKTYGGKKYASKASKATCMEQDLVAYKGWLARGWSPWPPAKNFKP